MNLRRFISIFSHSFSKSLRVFSAFILEASNCLWISISSYLMFAFRKNAFKVFHIVFDAIDVAVVVGFKNYSFIIVITALYSRIQNLILQFSTFRECLSLHSFDAKDSVKRRRRNKHFLKRWRFDWPKRTKWINKYVNTLRKKTANGKPSWNGDERNLMLRQTYTHTGRKWSYSYVSKTIIQNRFLFWIQMEYSCFYWGVFRSAVVKAKYTHTSTYWEWEN